MSAILNKKVKPLTTNDAFSSDFGRVQDMQCTWWLPYLALEWPLSALGGPFLTMLAEIGVETTTFPL